METWIRRRYDVIYVDYVDADESRLNLRWFNVDEITLTI